LSSEAWPEVAFKTAVCETGLPETFGKNVFAVVYLSGNIL
jgi:hypothetical protein